MELNFVEGKRIYTCPEESIKFELATGGRLVQIKEKKKTTVSKKVVKKPEKKVATFSSKFSVLSDEELEELNLEED